MTTNERAAFSALTNPASIDADGHYTPIMHTVALTAAMAVQWRLTHSAVGHGELQFGLYALGNHAQAVVLFQQDLQNFRNGHGGADERKQQLLGLAHHAAALAADELRGCWLAGLITSIAAGRTHWDLTEGLPAARVTALADHLMRLAHLHDTLEPLPATRSKADAAATQLVLALDDIAAEMVEGVERSVRGLPAALQPYVQLPDMPSPWLSRLLREVDPEFDARVAEYARGVSARAADGARRGSTLAPEDASMLALLLDEIQEPVACERTLTDGPR